MFNFFKKMRKTDQNVLSYPKCVLSKAAYTRHIPNDTHSKPTAGGYARNESGKPFYS